MLVLITSQFPGTPTSSLSQQTIHDCDSVQEIAWGMYPNQFDSAWSLWQMGTVLVIHVCFLAQVKMVGYILGKFYLITEF